MLTVIIIIFFKDFMKISHSNSSHFIPFVTTIIAVGVTSPNAQGQAITSTEINIVKANIPVSPPMKYQAKAEIRAIPITTGTKYPEEFLLLIFRNIHKINISFLYTLFII